MRPPDPVFEWGDWRFEPAEWRLTRASSGLVPLPNKSLSLLGLLLARAPRLVTKDEILQTIWEGRAVEEGNIAFHVAALRKVLDADGAPSCIETVRGRGYRFICPVTLVDEAPAAAAGPTAQPLVAEPAVALASPRRTRRVFARFAPAALLASFIAVLAWTSLVDLDATSRSVVVMPARSADGAPVDGIADAIAARLARQPNVRVVSSAWAAADEEALDAGRRLQAENVLTATVDRSTDPWRVELQLTRMHDRQRVWRWAFHLRPGEPAPASAIAVRAADGLGRYFGLDSRPDRMGAHPEAVALAGQARAQWKLRTPPSVQGAITLYQRALAIDPGYALAYAGLADCYNLTMSGLPVEVRAVNARVNAQRALSLDPDLAEAHTSQAFALYKFDWRWREAEAAFRRAIAADPSYALAHHWYGDMLALMGRVEEGIAELRRARALDPASLPLLIDLAAALTNAGRLAEAREAIDAAAAIDPMFFGVPLRMSAILAAEGRERESLEEDWRSQVLRGASLESIEALRAAYRRGGVPAVLRLEIAQLEAAAPERFAVPAHASFLAGKYARLRDREKTLYWIRTAIDRREDIALHLPTYPEYDWLRADPEFQKQLARIGLPGVTVE